MRKVYYSTRLIAYAYFIFVNSVAGSSEVFQTFYDLESVVDKEAEIVSIRALWDDGDCGEIMKMRQ